MPFLGSIPSSTSSRAAIVPARPSPQPLVGSRSSAPFFFTAQAQRTFWEVKFPDDVALVFGRESVGLPAALLARNRERTLRIPMVEPSLRSVNLSTTAGVAMFEVVRQRTCSPHAPG